jgi:cellulose synthase/poly-beta-1,6-N-acetylglucosamine synthase-like glycosyltransferase
MNVATEFFLYPTLFLTLFFEVFALLTFFDREARRRRRMVSSGVYPSVAIIIPAYNEEKTVRASVESVLALDYPKDQLSVVVVNDGSTDGTARALSAYRSNPRVTVLEKRNGGKHTALNLGIEKTNAELMGCLDADSFASPEALKEIVAHFDHARIGAVTASLSVNAPRSALERMQQAEYLLGIVFRHVLATLNGLYVTPGPLTLYRTQVFKEIGNFRSAHATEDMEMALRMQRGGWHIENAPRGRVYTTAPKTIHGLVKQRTRWTTGFLRNGFDYRELFGNPAHGVLGLMVLPLSVVAIVASIALFAFTIVNIGKLIWNFLEYTSRVPISYALTPRGFDIFFTPVSTAGFLSAITLALMVAFIFTGAQISKTRSGIGPGILWYALCYGVLAPVWLSRAVFDTAFGIRRTWH